MGWITAIAQIIKAIPEIWKLFATLINESKKRNARDDWDDFEERMKKEREQSEKENTNP